MSLALTAGSACHRQVSTTHASVCLAEAARQMRDEHVGSLVVVEETDLGRMVVGVLTDRDIVVGVVAKAVDPATLRVGDVVGDALFTLREDDTILDALAVMRGRGVRRLPVTTAAGMLVGVLALDDVLGIVADQLSQMVRAIRHEREVEVSVRG